MSMNRREFLTIAGISTIAGIGGTALAGRIAERRARGCSDRAESRCPHRKEVGNSY